jgi:excisionase family DNA binding protein
MSTKDKGNTMKTTEDEYLTYDQVARMLKCHRQTVRNAVEAGKLKAYKFGPGKRKMVRFKTSDVLKMVEKGGE